MLVSRFARLKNTIKATQTEIDQLNKQIENSTVLSTIDGIIKEVNRDGGTGENGNQKPLVSITQTSDFRVKGSISEMGSISEGTNVIVRSRINEDQIYKGTVTKVETDPQSILTITFMEMIQMNLHPNILSMSL